MASDLMSERETEVERGELSMTCIPSCFPKQSMRPGLSSVSQALLLG